MTFLEAAIEVLRRDGKPLHFKELTRLAIKYDLLSVVGRDPEQMMQTRLQAEVRRPTSELVRTSPGVFALRNPVSRPAREPSRPPREPVAAAPVAAPAEAAAKPAASAPAAPAAEGEKHGRRRGGRGSRGGRGGEAHADRAASPAAAAPTPSAPAAVEPAAAVSETAATVAEAAPPAAAPAAAAPAPAASADAAAPAAAADSHRGRRRRGDRRGPAPREAAATAASAASLPEPPVSPPAEVPPVASAAPAEVPAAAAPPAAAEPVAEAAAPATAPSSVSPTVKPEPAAPPAAAVTARPEVTAGVPAAAPAAERAPAPSAPPPSSRSPHPHHGGRSHAPPSTQSPSPGAQSSLIAPPNPVLVPVAPGSPNPPGGSANASRDQAPQSRNGGEPLPPRLMPLADAAYDVLRGSSDGRAVHFRQIAEIALKRRLVRGDLADVSRALRGALLREQRQREADGLRQRIRTVGQGQYSLGERKLEPDLYGAERDMLDRVNRTREATRVALRRRLRMMPAGPFELLMKLLLEKQGMVNAEIVKRGDGVAYYGGSYCRGSRNLKVLVAIRPGEAEISREAIGELRAGVRLRGFDEGLLLSAARLSAAAASEVAAAPGLEVYDHDGLTELLARHQLGIRRMMLPIDYLDTELFNELLDQN